MKFLLGVLHGKWLVRISWVAECLEKMCPANEERHEVAMDSGGRSSGPILGRMHAGLKLLKGWEVSPGPSVFRLGLILEVHMKNDDLKASRYSKSPS